MVVGVEEGVTGVEGERVGLGVGMGVRVGVGVREAVGEGEGLVLGVALEDREMEGVTLGEAPREREAEGLGEIVELWLVEPEGVPSGVALGEVVAGGVGVALGV